MYTIPWSMPIHQSDAHTVLTYVDHTLSQVPTKKKFMQILCQWLVSPPIYAQSQQTSKAIQPPSIL